MARTRRASRLRRYARGYGSRPYKKSGDKYTRFTDNVNASLNVAGGHPIDDVVPLLVYENVAGSGGFKPKVKIARIEVSGSACININGAPPGCLSAYLCIAPQGYFTKSEMGNENHSIQGNENFVKQHPEFIIDSKSYPLPHNAANIRFSVSSGKLKRIVNVGDSIIVILYAKSAENILNNTKLYVNGTISYYLTD